MAHSESKEMKGSASGKYAELLGLLLLLLVLVWVVCVGSLVMLQLPVGVALEEL